MHITTFHDSLTIRIISRGENNEFTANVLAHTLSTSMSSIIFRPWALYYPTIQWGMKAWIRSLCVFDQKVKYLHENGAAWGFLTYWVLSSSLFRITTHMLYGQSISSGTSHHSNSLQFELSLSRMAVHFRPTRFHAQPIDALIDSSGFWDLPSYYTHSQVKKSDELW